MKSVTQKIKNFLEMWNLFLLLALKPYFAERILAIDLSKTILKIKFLRFQAKITKISTATIYDHKNFCS